MRRIHKDAPFIFSGEILQLAAPADQPAATPMTVAEHQLAGSQASMEQQSSAEPAKTEARSCIELTASTGQPTTPSTPAAVEATMQASIQQQSSKQTTTPRTKGRIHSFLQKLSRGAHKHPLTSSSATPAPPTAAAQHGTAPSQAAFEHQSCMQAPKSRSKAKGHLKRFMEKLDRAAHKLACHGKPTVFE